MNKLTLAGGRSIPCMGYGCYNAFGEELTRAVEAALEAGYTYIDSAEMYNNEDAVGAALAHASSRREELFVLSKAWPTSFDDLEKACTGSLKNLKTEYLDAYLLHWPGTKEDRRLAAYEQMLKLVDRGLVYSPGVSNFSIEQLEKIKEEFGAYPAIHEIECHPSYQQREMIQWCEAHDIRIISYEPINRTADLSLPAVVAIAEKYSRTPAQIILRWHIQHNQLPIPKSSHAERIRENIALFDFELAPEDMAAIDALETGIRSGKDPLHFPENC